MESQHDGGVVGGTLGRWAASLHPLALWNKVFAQTREDIIREDIAEAERRARDKAAYEAQYHAMKQAGLFKPTPIGNIYRSNDSNAQTPRDSAVILRDDDPPIDPEPSRSTSHLEPFLRPATALRDDTSASDTPETGSKPARTIKSRLHLKRPSLANISGNLKRAKSDFSLTKTLHDHETSSSVSPTKTAFETPSLKPSQSRHDLKKQLKLSKRVSDLETKLSHARSELAAALNEASPAPHLPGRHERFTPQSTLKRPKFVPGALPSLPSERLLTAKLSGADVGRGDATMIDLRELESPPADAASHDGKFQVQKYGDATESADGADTIKAPTRPPPHPPRVSSLFSHHNGNIEQVVEPTEDPAPELDGGDAVDPPAADAKVKRPAKIKKSAAKTRKRKSGLDEMDQAYKPEGTSDDTGADEPTPKKRRKAVMTEARALEPVFEAAESDEPVRAVPGEAGVPPMPKTHFEWPDDVF